MPQRYANPEARPVDRAASLPKPTRNPARSRLSGFAMLAARWAVTVAAMLAVAAGCAPHGSPVTAPQTVAIATVRARVPRAQGGGCYHPKGPRDAVPLRPLPSADSHPCDRLPPGAWGHTIASDRMRVLWPVDALGVADPLARCEPPRNRTAGAVRLSEGRPARGGP